jgi:hypothetical protein
VGPYIRRTTVKRANCALLDLGCWISGDCMYYGYTEVSGPDALRYMFSLLGDDDLHAGGAGYGAGTALVCCAAD